MEIDRCLPDYLQQCNDCFHKIGCLKEKHCNVVDIEEPPVINLSRRMKSEVNF